MNKDVALNAIFGAILGDIVGSVYEAHNTKDYNFKWLGWSSHYTDDSILTIATADWIAHGGAVSSYYDTYGNKYPAGYGKGFRAWLATTEKKPYCSSGDGSAMRISPVGCYGKTLEEVLELAKTSASCTHNDTDGIEGAQFVAAAIFLIRQGLSKEEIKEKLSSMFTYDLNLNYDEVKKDYGWKYGATCKGTVPYAFVAFFESTDLEDAIRKAVSLGGDSDTIGAICGSMAGAFYGVADKHIDMIYKKLPKEFIDVINQFAQKVSTNI